MTDGVTFSDESRQRSILRKAEYDESEPRDLVLNIPKRNGGQITVPLLKKARANIEREDYQENTLLRVKPLAEIESALPISTGYGAPVNQGKAVALLRPGYLYVFRRGRIWRELEIGSDSKLSDVDLRAIKTDLQSLESQLRVERSAAGEWLDDLLVPVFLQGQAVMHDFRMAYSEVQWDWGYVEKLESDEQALAARTTGIGHAWAVTTVDSLSFQSGFPASRVEDLPELRERDLGIELMLENPRDFSPGFERPSDTELCAKLAKRLKSNQEGDDEPIEIDIECESGQDVLSGLRGQKGLACIALPDPLFRLRHSLAQLQMALHYLDALDVSIKKNPMAHSAMLIRQAVFDPSPNGNPGALAKYAEAINRQKLDDVLQASEKDHAVRVIEGHVDELLESMRGRKLDPFFEDYRECSDVAISEAYLLIADKLNVLQQIPGVLNAHGVQSRSDALTGLRQWILNGSFLTDWAPESGSTEETADGAISLFYRLEQLAQDQTEIDGELQNRLNIQSLIYLEKQVKERQESEDGIARDLSDAGKVGGLVSGALGEWSSALLTVCKRLIEEGAVQQVEIQRIMQAASSNIVLTSPDLRGIEVMDRAGAVSRGSIVGLLGNGINRGLTDFDRSEGILTRKNDYLYADLLDESDDLVASSSPTRAAAAVEEAVNKVAGGTLVFFAPADHPEARKLALIKVDLAKRVGKVVDGPVVSRGLVVLAAFNAFLEFHVFLKAYGSERENAGLSFAKAFGGAGADLIAASFKLSAVLGEQATEKTRLYKFAARPLFDVKNWPMVGSRLRALQANTLVRTVGLASFVAGTVGVGLSFWEMRISLSNKDFDAATGHATAMAGGLVFLASPLLATMLAIPGWGWAILGMAFIVGGGLYAGVSKDDSFEQLLKRGPWGTHPEDMPTIQDDHAYYSQLLSLLSPIQVNVQKYADVDPDPALSHPNYAPTPQDYVITVTFPLISRMQLYRGSMCRGDLPTRSFNLVVQELAYQSSNTNLVAPGSVAPVSTAQLVKSTPLTKVTARQSMPHESAVRFLVKREFDDSEYRSLFYQESVTTKVRVGIQAILDTELGPVVFPTPTYENYTVFDVSQHSAPPSKERAIFAPYSQPDSPYWHFTEVSA